MANLMLHRDLLLYFNKLPVKVQKKVAEFIDLFQKNPLDPVIGLHALKETMLDPKVRGARLPDGYRAIIIAPEKGDTYLLMHIDAHDKAYAWARNKKFEVHERTGIFQVFDVKAIEEAAQQSSPPPPSGTGYPFSDMTDDELFQAGVPRPLLPAVRAIRSDEALENLSTYLPVDCREVLRGMAAGMTLDESLDEMLGLSAQEMAAHVPEGTGDFSKIDTAASFDLVLVEGEEHLKEVLQASLEEWRVFLHPYQKKLVEWETKGPMNITGAAGTGKTVALIHRAVHLAKKLTNPKSRVLVTNYTTNLSVTIKHHIKRLCPETAERIEVTNLHALARILCARSGWKGRIAEDEDQEAIWEEVWIDPCSQDLPMSRDEIREEFKWIIDANGIEDEEAYLTTVRTGRPRLDRQGRKRAWPVFRAFLRGLKKRNLLTFEGAIHQARLAAENGSVPPYTHVLVDEVQDFSLEALRLIRALSPIGQGTPDPLCTVGDGHQRIYRKKIPLSRAGIDIRGRSRRLKVNYRTSEEIRKYAQGILKGLDIDDLDEGITQTTGDHSAFRGTEPMIERCVDEMAEAEAIVAWIETLIEAHGFSSHEICVVPHKDAMVKTLSQKGLSFHVLKINEEDPGPNYAGVRLGSMMRIKGLEFRAIAMACCDPADPMNRLEEADLLSRCERYVAATRAREHLLITLAASRESSNGR